LPPEPQEQQPGPPLSKTVMTVQRATLPDRSRPIDHRWRRIFQVWDNGVGFDSTLTKKLFNPFRRLRRADQFELSGVGLTAAQRIVGKHPGHIWAYSAPEEGSMFRFTGPLNKMAREPLRSSAHSPRN
jgi:signal transduction histidine kinase